MNTSTVLERFHSQDTTDMLLQDQITQAVSLSSDNHRDEYASKTSKSVMIVEEDPKCSTLWTPEPFHLTLPQAIPSAWPKGLTSALKERENTCAYTGFIQDGPTI